MQLKKLFNEDDAVSPVIGVILMVAITVILAAVIATFVLGLGEQVSDTAPQASFNFDYNETGAASDVTDSFNNTVGTDVRPASVDGVLTIQHSNGPSIDPGLLSVTGSNVTEVDTGGTLTAYDDFSKAANTTWNNDKMSAGNSLDIFMEDTDTITLVWENDDGSTSATLKTFEGPEA